MWIKFLPLYFDYCLYEKEFSVYKVNNYRKVFKWLSGKLPLPFTLNEAREFILLLKRDKSPAYINHIITAINSFIRWCPQGKVPQEDFALELNKIRPKFDRTPDANKLLSIEEVLPLLATPSRPLNSPEYRKLDNFHKEDYFLKVDQMYNLLFSLMYKTCARSGELVKLTKKDFNFSNHSFTLYKTKNGSNRIVGIPPSLEETLKSLLLTLQNNEYLFKAHTHCSNLPLSQEMCNRTIQYRAKLCGLNRVVTIHMLRHSGITHKLINGAPLSVVQQMAGHKRLATTELYTHVIVQNQIDCMLHYDPSEIANQSEEQVLTETERFIDSLCLEKTKLLKEGFIEKYSLFVKNILHTKSAYIEELSILLLLLVEFDCF